MNTTPLPHEDDQRDDERPPAVRHAEIGATAWREAAHAQRSAAPDHTDFYSFAATLDPTFAAIESLIATLAAQVETYAHQPAGQRVYDDSRNGPGEVDPRERLADAADYLHLLHELIAESATRYIAEFWNAIGHIGVEDTHPHRSGGAGAGGGR
jgi:hypothetical protein